MIAIGKHDKEWTRNKSPFCFGNGAERISRNNSKPGKNKSPFCFGNGAERISRNNSKPGNYFMSIPNRLVMIPYEINTDAIMPVTIHTTTRQQIKFRLKTGRVIYE